MEKSDISEKRKRYDSLILRVFRNHFNEKTTSFDFLRSELEEVAQQHPALIAPKNLGDIIYSYRFRIPFPVEISRTATAGKEWAIRLTGKGKYRFELGPPSAILPRANAVATKIPDATPEIIAKYAQTDEQALLAKVRYNRLIDIFLGITTYSLQSHLRTSIRDIGQIEIDELYIGINRFGQHFAIPVQAKGGKDKISTLQAEQDHFWCSEKMPYLACRPIAAQFLDDGTIALFEIAKQDEDFKLADERHYRLVPRDEIKDSDLKAYSIK